MSERSTHLPDSIIEREFQRAVSLARIPHHEVALVLCEADAVPGGVGGAWLAPNLPQAIQYFFGDASAMRMGNTPPLVHRHRICVPRRVNPSATAEAWVGAILSHETYHAVEWRNGGRGGLRLQPVVTHVLHQMHGPSIPGTAMNKIPYEMDSNAQASRFLRRFHPSALPMLLASDDSALARASEPPTSPLTLHRRVVEFIREQVAELDEPLVLPPLVTDLVEWMESASPGSAQIWADLDRRAA